MTDPIWSVNLGKGPLVAAAIHDGHAARDEISRLFAISEADRLREEDPFTAKWTTVASTSIVALCTRFEVDLNRPRHSAVYMKPDDAWGLRVWQDLPPADVVARSLAEYDAFYEAVGRVLSGVAEREGRFVVYDLHSYNHRRDGPDAPPANATDNPQINIGTSNMNREFWAPVVDRFIADLRAYPFPAGPLDVRENIRFQGGHFVRWIHEQFPGTGCALAIEIKKFFMDEWTGEADRSLIATIGEALCATAPAVAEALRQL
jgi:N-formylglutamate deformylase